MVELGSEVLAKKFLNELVLHLRRQNLEEAKLMDDRLMVVPEGPGDPVLYALVESAGHLLRAHAS